MTSDRCPACGAAVTPGAPWCTLCYQNLRPEPAADPASAPVAQPVAEPAIAASSRSGAISPQSPSHGLPPDPILDAPVMTAADAAAILAPSAPAAHAVAAPVAAAVQRATWPCHTCHAQVPIEDNACPHCGSSFLPSDATPSLVLPGVGDIVRMEKGGRALLMVGGAVGLMLVFFLVMLVFGAIL